MGARYLADTNAVSDLVLGRLPASSATWFDSQLAQSQVAISVVTQIELLSKAAPAAEYAFMQSFVQSVGVLPLNEVTVQQTIQLRQHYRIKLPDAIIAATALAHDLALLTRNTRDFNAITQLQVLDPHDSTQLIL